MTSTIFGKNPYDDGIRHAIGTVIDDWTFRFPGIQDVEHVYFYAAAVTGPLVRGASIGGIERGAGHLAGDRRLTAGPGGEIEGVQPKPGAEDGVLPSNARLLVRLGHCVHGNAGEAGSGFRTVSWR